MKSKADILEEILQERHSVYPWGYTKDQVPAETVRKILAASGFTPNHKKTKPWRFKIFDNAQKDALGEQLSSLYKQNVPPEKFKERKFQEISNKLKLSSSIITVSVAFSGKVPEWEEIAATMMAVENMYLMSTALGVGCYFSSTHLAEDLKSFLQLAENEKCLGLFYIGFEKDFEKEALKKGKEKKSLFGFLKK